MIGFAGMSHLGLVSSVAAAAAGFDVIAFDSQVREPITDDVFACFEPGLRQIWSDNRARIHFTSRSEQLRGCDLIFLSQDVDTDSHGGSDLSRVEALLRIVADASSPGSVLVVLSQVPPGSTRRWSLRFRDRDMRMYYQVETLILGQALDRASNPERIIVGCEDPQETLPPSYGNYLSAFPCPVFQLQYESAELSKIAINTFLASSISTTNVVAELCERLGADWDEIASTLRLDKRIGAHAYLASGLGIGGGNLERDLRTLKDLSACFGTDTRLVDAWIDGSRYFRDWALRRLHSEVLGKVADPTVGVWGLAYKADTASTKNSPALALLDALRPFAVRAYDPRAVLPDRPSHVIEVDRAIDACAGADVLAIMTPWSDFRSIPIAKIKTIMRGRVIIDPYQVLDRRECLFHGMRHCCLGKPTFHKEVVR